MRSADPGLDIETMLEAARRARRFVDGLSEQEFLSDELRQSAVAMCLVAIGECAKRLTRQMPDFVAAHDLDWSKMARMRDRIAHGYETLSMTIIWATLKEDIEPLIQRLEPILASLPDPDTSTPD